MIKLALVLLSFALLGLGGCQSTPPAETKAPAATPVAVAPAVTEPQLAVPTGADARATVARFILTQPNPTRYVVDSALVNDDGDTWQVLVPRTDWAQRMPNRARFTVSKATGFVRTEAVK